MRQRSKSKTVILVLSTTVAALALIGVGAVAFLKNWHPLSDKENENAPQQPSPVYAHGRGSEVTDYLVAGIDNTGSLTDVIMIVSVNSVNKTVSILQIPRDTYVDLDIPTNKYNAIYSHHDKGESGMEKLVSQVEKDFGVKISNYFAVTTGGFRSMVDAVGGVEIDVPIDMNYDDPKQDLHIHLKKGKQLLDGKKAEQFVRYRKGWSQGDVGRLSAQQLFLSAFKSKIRDMSAAETASKLLPIVKKPDFKTDMSALDMMNLYNSQRDISLQNSAVYTMPGEYYTSSEGLSMYSVHKADLLAILNKSFVASEVTLTEDDIDIKEVSSKEKTSASSRIFSE